MTPDEIESRRHALHTAIVLAGGGTEWYVAYVNFKWTATSNDPEHASQDFQPPPEKNFEDALRTWPEWFRCQEH